MWPVSAGGSGLASVAEPRPNNDSLAETAYGVIRRAILWIDALIASPRLRTLNLIES